MSTELVRRVARAIRLAEQTGECDLSGLELTALPPSVTELGNLQILLLRGNRLTELPPAIGRLGQLRVLALDDNKLSGLPAEIGRLSALERLTVSANHLVDLPADVGHLGNLESLTVSRNRLASLPAEICRLGSLETLAVSGNRLTGLPPEFGQLANLNLLSVADNRLTSLPSSLAGLLRLGLLLRIEGNPFDGPVLELYNRSPVVLAAYLDSLADGVPQREAKMMLVGEGNTGKTSLIAALRGTRFIDGRPTTHGIEIHSLSLRDESAKSEVAVHAWDFGGQEIYRVTHQLFFTKHALYIVVWKPRDGQEQNEVEGWLRRIRLRVSDDSRVFIVATHCSGERHPDLDYPALAREFPKLLAGNFEIDNQTGFGIDQLRRAVAAEVGRLTQRGQTASPRWIAAREEILSLASTEPQISFEKFTAICLRCGLEKDQVGALADALHLAGQIIHYSDDPTLKDFLVLNPEWLTKAIGYVLEDEDIRQAGGILQHGRLRHIWQERNGVSYPVPYHPYFLRLMERFGVSYRLADDSDRSLVAQLVPYNRPPLPWDARIPPSSARIRRLAMVCRLSEPAPGLIAWLTVRHHEAATGTYWRNGVFLRHPIETYASEALLDLRTPTLLGVEVRAPSPDYFFNVLRFSIEDIITRRWPGLGYELLVPCPTVTADGSPCPNLIPMDDLMIYREEGETRFLCAKCRTKYDISALLTGFSQPTVSLQAELDRLHADIRAEMTDVRTDISDLQATAADTAHVIRRILHAVSTEITDCPRLFTLARDDPSGRRRLRPDQDHFRLVLWCEQPGHWHPWPDATYLVDQPKEVIAKIAPYAILVFRALQLTVPVVSAVAGLTLPAGDARQVTAELQLMAAVVADLPGHEPEQRPDLAGLGTAGRMTTAQGAAWRALRSFLFKRDTARAFGDLRRVQAASGDFLWVCPRHHAQYDPGLPHIP
jgi:internalin A